jgi:RecJ-like exonuclease
MSYQPKTGEPCACKPGVQRDNCPACEGTGQRIDFAAIRARAEFRASLCGTRKTERRGTDDYRVVCATCGGGGTVRHRTAASASSACTRDSARPCPVGCGAK